MRIYLLIFLFFPFLISGCASFTSPARQHMLEDGKTYWFDYSADRRGAVLIPKHEKKSIAICAEPSPDVALEIVNKFKADVGTGKITLGAEADIQEKVIQLAKRTQTIMFLRESLYRLCELSLNFQFEPDKVRELYEKVIGAAVNMAAAELENAEQSRIEAQTRKIEIMQKASEHLIKLHYKIDLIIAYVQDNGKVNKERLKKLTKDTGLDESFINEFAGKDIAEFKRSMEGPYLSNVDALAKNINE